MPTALPIALGHYESFSKKLAAQECVNLYPSTPQTPGASSRQALFQTPGIKQFANLGASPNRMLIKAGDDTYAVNGDTLYQIDSSGTVHSRGAVFGTGTGELSMAFNGATIAIIEPGVAGWFFLLGSAVAIPITDAVFLSFMAQTGGVLGVTYVDSYFVYATKEEFFNGSVRTTNDGQDFNALDFGTAEVKPDTNVMPFTTKNELYIFGDDSVELYRTISTVDFPFQRIDGATIDKGATAQFSIVEFDNSFVWVGGAKGETDAVWRGLSGSATKISTTAIDKILADHTLLERQAASAFTYSEHGHLFVGFSLADITLVYDGTESALQGRPVWHARETSDSRWRVQGMVDAFGKTIVGDLNDGKIGHLSLDYTNDYGTAPERRTAGAYVENQGRPVFVSSIELFAESGVGNEAGDGDERPVVSLAISDDGGHNFSDLGSKALGIQDDRAARQIWHRIGRTPETRIFRLTVQEDVKIAFNGMAAEMEAGF